MKLSKFTNEKRRRINLTNERYSEIFELVVSEKNIHHLAILKTRKISL
jgi:hypothetical protein